MIYELRTYTATPGNADKLHARFRDHTRDLFKRHGIESVGYWTANGDPGTLVYIVACKDKAAHAAGWDAFRKDPDWQKVKGDSEVNGPLVERVESVMLEPTDFSALK